MKKKLFSVKELKISIWVTNAARTAKSKSAF